MLRLATTRNELQVVADQYGIPTSCEDLSNALAKLACANNSKNIYHFSNSCKDGGISWADFAREIFSITRKNIQVVDCSTNNYPTRAKRPSWSVLINNSDIVLPDWKEGLNNVLKSPLLHI
jgi:dTDP-4-dehydrorhamnose reductase